jgi:hypothetical protein
MGSCFSKSQCSAKDCLPAPRHRQTKEQVVLAQFAAVAADDAALRHHDLAKMRAESEARLRRRVTKASRLARVTEHTES